ncbi:MAG: hypothetical protein JSV08_06180 [Acidobacteriota bacterium]|nr:MAG: hypothetical protein JSV08_06180 [Acidobacteriota bacterium]
MNVRSAVSTFSRCAEALFRREHIPTFSGWAGAAGRRVREELRFHYPRVAVEISAVSVKAVRLEPVLPPRAPEFLLHHAERPLEEGVVDVNLLDMEVARPADVAQGVARALEAVGGLEAEASVLFPSLVARAAFLEIESLPASPAERLDMVRWKIAGKLPYSAQLARIVYEVQPAVNGKHPVFAVAVKEAIVLAMEEIFQTLGIHAGFLQPAGFALLYAAPRPGRGTLHLIADEHSLLLAVTCGDEVRFLRTKNMRHLSALRPDAGVGTTEDEFTLPISAAEEGSALPNSTTEDGSREGYAEGLRRELEATLAYLRQQGERFAFDVCRLSAGGMGEVVGKDAVEEAVGVPVESYPWPEKVRGGEAVDLPAQPGGPPVRDALAALVWTAMGREA